MALLIVPPGLPIWIGEKGHWIVGDELELPAALHDLALGVAIVEQTKDRVVDGVGADFDAPGAQLAQLASAQHQGIGQLGPAANVMEKTNSVVPLAWGKVLDGGQQAGDRSAALENGPRGDALQITALEVNRLS